MSDRYFAALVAVAAIMLMVPVAAAPQGSAPTADGWTVPRTADGQPDLQGIWASDSATPTDRGPGEPYSGFSSDQRSASMAAPQPVPAAVTACR